MIDILSLIGRDEPLFSSDMARVDTELKDIVNQSKFLVVGGAGSIGSAVVKEIFAREPKTLDVVDISENNDIYIYINSLAAYIMPFRCFKSLEEQEEFLNFIKEKEI